MYTLVLTHGERKAFDWVGDRYSAGEVKGILTDCMQDDVMTVDEEEKTWDGPDPIKFVIPEWRAWQIQDLAKRDMEGGHSAWPCFGRELRDKLNDFLDRIV